MVCFSHLWRWELLQTGDCQVGNWHVNCQHSNCYNNYNNYNEIAILLFHRKYFKVSVVKRYSVNYCGCGCNTGLKRRTWKLNEGWVLLKSAVDAGDSVVVQLLTAEERLHYWNFVAYWTCITVFCRLNKLHFQCSNSSDGVLRNETVGGQCTW